jgi:hypothetical protein
MLLPAKKLGHHLDHGQLIINQQNPGHEAEANSNADGRARRILTQKSGLNLREASLPEALPHASFYEPSASVIPISLIRVTVSD